MSCPLCGLEEREKDADVKLEYLNSGGSMEDRAAIRMVEVAEQNGLTKDQAVVAPASGNVAVGIALACAVKGYRCIIVSPSKSGHDVEDVLVALGAEVVLANLEAHHKSITYYDFAKIVAQGIKNSYFLDEEASLANSLAHYETTAVEIATALNNKVDLIVVPVRTGAALQGISKYAEQHLPGTKVYGVCNDDSFPPVPELGHASAAADISSASGIEEVSSKDAFLMARRLIKEEGVMVGPSSGAAVFAAFKLAERLPEGSNVVVLGADGIRNYM
ncbi:pyridoxal-phosphate dependent protein [Teladorsagia circumcincta]|uniref:Pyridoxal-phosphate dependent protein n=1 Tax=Teladorsagia circumcincta TaxID=45464 RepID=A0A2G9UNQ8_TELCI|nr:pyridoxal-phosphate dependent protein [Teladorsagia circumcincta]